MRLTARWVASGAWGHPARYPVHPDPGTLLLLLLLLSVYLRVKRQDIAHVPVVQQCSNIILVRSPTLSPVDLLAPITLNIEPLLYILLIVPWTKLLCFISEFVFLKLSLCCYVSGTRT